MIGRRSRAALVVPLGLSLLVGCGGRSALDSYGGWGEPRLRPGAAPSLEGCAAPLLVPAGDVWIGSYSADRDGNARPLQCHASLSTATELLPTRSFLVPNFFLDPDEATNRCYQHCVEAGACPPPPIDPEASASWTDPSLARWPAAVDEASAKAFCAFRGGRLASVAELTRAAQSDAAEPCPAEVLAKYSACNGSLNQADGCFELATRIAAERPLGPVRSHPEEAGPFGHHDLLGSQIEVTQTHITSSEGETMRYCALPDEWYAPKTFSREPTYSVDYAPLRALAETIFRADTDGIEESRGVLFDAGDDGLPFVKGVHCAYDPAIGD